MGSPGGLGTRVGPGWTCHSQACGQVSPPPGPQVPPLKVERRLRQAERSLGGGVGLWP